MQERGSQRRSVLSRILAGGLIASSIDIGAAALINWISPAIILRYIASGLIGPQALHLGTFGAVLGLLLQWLMGIIIAAIFVLGALFIGPGRLSSSGRWIAAALGYGVVIFLVMNYVVMPLSAIHRAAHFTPVRAAENLLAMLLFALIVAFCVRPAQRSSLQEVKGFNSPSSSV